ncbi:MAG: hypothetical protein AAGL34_12270 [Bacteroidota bacterium]
MDDLQRERLARIISEGYGSSSEFAKQLDLVIEMLFYVERDNFSTREIQNAVTAIRSVIVSLRG